MRSSRFAHLATSDEIVGILLNIKPVVEARGLWILCLRIRRIPHETADENYPKRTAAQIVNI
jgi:hypothetical protein